MPCAMMELSFFSEDDWILVCFFYCLLTSTASLFIHTNISSPHTCLVTDTCFSSIICELTHGIRSFLCGEIRTTKTSAQELKKIFALLTLIHRHAARFGNLFQVTKVHFTRLSQLSLSDSI